LFLKVRMSPVITISRQRLATRALRRVEQAVLLHN
jgi:hypothetical protein